MIFHTLQEGEKAVVCKCFSFILRSGLIDDAEFQTRLGLVRSDLEEVARLCPNLDDSNLLVELSINNCLNEVCYGLPISEDDWPKWFTVPKNEVEHIYTKWAKLKGWAKTGIL